MLMPYSAEEQEYEGLVLPDDFKLDTDTGGGDLMDAITAVVTRTPLRWRLELADLVPQYVADYGPRWRKYKKLVRALGR